MVLNRTDELAVAACRQCVDRCHDRRINPAPYFPLLLRMYEELKAHGLIQMAGELPADVCDGCPAYRYGSCMNGYQMATLSLDGSKVVKCGYKRIAQTRSV